VEDDLGGAETVKRRRRRSGVKTLEELRDDWGWLLDIKPEDKPWLYYALHKAYHSRVTRSGKCLYVLVSGVRALQVS
jgi:hypothetical protein